MSWLWFAAFAGLVILIGIAPMDGLESHDAIALVRLQVSV
jgi:hypothetical protein